ncbi:MAG: 2-oxoglutarate ferredoxin oxidoreductase subunit gamma, partial [Ignavibacteria bacterium]|nr:2-oxoglutarate ferredoxin oxidoreductase subunit gamma [Ignavibacteria bacterium]
GLEKVLPERYHHLIPLNKEAIEKGMELAEKATVTA